MAIVPGQKYAIINADDLGFCVGVTEGIVRAHREGILTSTTIMANMPGADEAASIARDVPTLGVGVHLNVSQGSPLSSSGRTLAGPDGIMHSTATDVIWKCSRDRAVRAAIKAEFDAQIRWVLDHGLVPTHLDTHRHAHAFGPIFADVCELAGHYNIRFVRHLRERLPGRGWPTTTAKNRRLRLMINLAACLGGHGRRRPTAATLGTWGVAHTGAIDRQWLILAARRLPAGVTEIMTHPGLLAGLDPSAPRLVESRQAELEALCDPDVRQAMQQNNVKLIHYGQIE